MRSKITRSALLLAAVVAPLTTASAQLTQIFPVTQVWSYDTACHDGDNWQAVGFNDSGWLRGPGAFTGGETNPVIMPIVHTSSLPAPGTLSPAGHAMYFRTHFNVASTSGLFLTMSNAIDDGAVFYLNGTQILNLRVTTPGSCASFSSVAIGSGSDALLWEVHTFAPADLANIVVPGDNLLAVEVHQVFLSSPDMVFGMILMGPPIFPFPPPPPIGFTNGTGVITFDTAPPSTQWSTITGTGTQSDFDGTADGVLAALDTAAKTNDASIIRSDLTILTGNPPTSENRAAYASDAGARYIQTCPTGNAYTRLMATLTNLTGSAVNSLGIRYDLTVRSAVVEQLAGHLVYYSTSGAPGSWVQIPELNDQNTDNVAGTYAKAADITLTTPWAANSKMYFLWCDDNANPANPDTRYGIDNVQFVLPPPIFFDNMTNRTVAQCQSTTFTAGGATGSCSSFAYQWYKTDVGRPIGGATNIAYTIAKVQPADAGVYFVRAVCSAGTAESHHATLTVIPTPAFEVVKAVASTNRTNIVVSFNLPVDPTAVDPNGAGMDVRQTGSGASLGVVSASVLDGTNVLVVAGSPMAAGASYQVEFQNAGVGNTCTTNKISGNFPVTTAVVIQIDPSFQRADLIWPSGVLQWNTNLSRGIGWTDVPGSGNVGLATSPYTVYWGPGNGPGKANGTNQMFFRLRF